MHIFVHPYLSNYFSKRLYLFSYLSPCLCVSVALHVHTTVVFVSCRRGSTEFRSHGGMGGGLLGGGWWWMDVSGGESAGAARSMMVRGFSRPPHLPTPHFPVSRHSVIRVTVRSCLAPIGHANNSFNNPGPCYISLLFGPRCHAKSPAMEKQLHRHKDGMPQ